MEWVLDIFEGHWSFKSVDLDSDHYYISNVDKYLDVTGPLFTHIYIDVIMSAIYPRSGIKV